MSFRGTIQNRRRGLEAYAGGLPALRTWGKILAGEDWRGELSQRDDSDAAAALRSSTSRGRPVGSDSFMSKIEKLVGRRLRPLPVGRPRQGRET